MGRLLGEMTPVQRRRLVLGLAVLGLLAVATALQPPPAVGPRDCRSGLDIGTVTKKNGKRIRACVLRAGGRTIFVSRLRKGPKRAVVRSLEDVKTRYQGACVANPGRDYVVTSEDSDQVDGSNASERMVGLAGRNSFDGKLGNDCIDGGSDDDVLFGRGGDDVVFGGPGDDELNGGGGEDSLHGGDGNDVLDGGPAADRLFGGAGDDVIRAGVGADVISGGEGDDAITAPRPGMRSLNCGPGRDTATVSGLNRARVHNCEQVRFVTG
jgi:Ca2+-binding RTX toxin-like protein